MNDVCRFKLYRIAANTTNFCRLSNRCDEHCSLSSRRQMSSDSKGFRIKVRGFFLVQRIGPDGTVANGLVGTGFASRYRLQP